MDFESLAPRERNILIALVATSLVMICLLVVVAVAPSLRKKPTKMEPTLASVAVLPTQPLPSATSVPTRTPQPTNTLVVPIEDYNRSLVERITAQVMQIRQLGAADEATFSLLNREQMTAEMQTFYSPEQLRTEVDREWLLYKILGLVAEDVTLSDEQVGYLANQFAGLYLSDQDHLYVVTERVNMNKEDEIVFAHEYTHALQDKHFDLDSYLLNATTTDANLAARALVEGDATLVMAIYAYGNTTQAQWDYLAYRASFAEQPELIELESVSEQASRIVSFPYAEGVYFVLNLFLQGGWPSVNGAFSDLPRSTEQVLHPEKYLGSRDWPQEIALPETSLDGWQLILEDTLGEFVLSVHLENFLGDPEQALEAAAGWDGDRIGLWQDGQGRWLVLWQTAWDSDAEATQFEEAYRALIPTRFEGATATADNWWEEVNLAVGLLRENDRVWLVWGPDRATAEAVLEAGR